MSEFFRTSTWWVIDFRYDGSPRRWFKAFGPNVDVADVMAAELRNLYGARARLGEVRKASAEEEGAYLRGDAPKNAFCPTGRGASGKPVD